MRVLLFKVSSSSSRFVRNQIVLLTSCLLFWFFVSKTVAFFVQKNTGANFVPYKNLKKYVPRYYPQSKQQDYIRRVYSYRSSSLTNVLVSSPFLSSIRMAVKSNHDIVEKEIHNTGDVVDLTGDGGVLKKVIRKGFGFKTQPTIGSTCYIKYSMTLSNGTLISASDELEYTKADVITNREDSKTNRRKGTFDFILKQSKKLALRDTSQNKSLNQGMGDDLEIETDNKEKQTQEQEEVFTSEVIEGWDICVASMIPNEICEVTCTYPYAFGKAGVDGYIPASSSIISRIELIDWVSLADCGTTNVEDEDELMEKWKTDLQQSDSLTPMDSLINSEQNGINQERQEKNEIMEVEEIDQMTTTTTTTISDKRTISSNDIIEVTSTTNENKEEETRMANLSSSNFDEKQRQRWTSSKEQKVLNPILDESNNVPEKQTENMNKKVEVHTTRNVGPNSQNTGGNDKNNKKEYPRFDISDNDLSSKLQTDINGYLNPNQIVEGKTNLYSWRETSDYIDVYIPVPFSTKKEDIIVGIEKQELQIAIDGNRVMNGILLDEIRIQNAHWFIERDEKSTSDNARNLTAAEKKELTRGHVCIYIHLPKKNPKIWAKVYQN